MPVRIEVLYGGDLHCAATHGPSGDRLVTDAPKDNQGKGEHFSPTDLVATALGTCVLTTMGIAARARGLDLRGSRAVVEKEMSSVPRRHISRLTLDLTLPDHLAPDARRILERTASTCPVAASLGPDTRVEMAFTYAKLTAVP